METIRDDLDGTLVILFEPGENPDIPSGYEKVERTEPEYFHGLLNPGRIVCRRATASPNKDCSCTWDIRTGEAGSICGQHGAG